MNIHTLRLLKLHRLYCAPAGEDGSNTGGTNSGTGTDGQQNAGGQGSGTPAGGTAGDGNGSVATGGQPNGQQTPPQNTGQQQPQVPDTYKFELPEGMMVDDKTTADFSALAKDAKLTQEQANKFVGFYANMVKAQEQAHAETQRGWVDAVKSDKDLGGDKLQATTTLCKSVMDKFGSPELSDYLNGTGLGNHPALVRFVAKIGAAMSEDSFVKGGNAAGAAMPLEQTLFPSMAPKQ